MPQTIANSIENNFTKGLITESTGLNFPENAATDTDNCTFTLIGDIQRRSGYDQELNGQWNSVSRNSAAINSYKWNNAGGDGNTQIVVVQVGSSLYFYRSSTATSLAPLSKQLLGTVDITNFSTNVPALSSSECQFADGNGYLFVYNTNCTPFFCSYANGVVTGNAISIKIRDFIGTQESIGVSVRPIALSNEHLYNLTNQGWSQGNPWYTTSSTTQVVGNGNKVFTVAAGMSVTLGDFVNISTASDWYIGGPFGRLIPAGTGAMGGTVVAYSGTSMTINSIGSARIAEGESFNNWILSPYNHGYIDSWHTAVGNYPSNSDVWWYFKDTTNIFNPAITSSQVTLNTGPAPKGHYLVDAFDQNKSLISGISGLNSITTNTRPRTGTWFQGRVWYTGVDDSHSATGNSNFYTWTESLYFSQVVVDPSQFGQCYQTNDPTSEKLFDLLPTDGGVINIQGCGSIYKLFPIQNGMLVFANNGVWYITGSQGIGFAANDYTITKISSIQSISSTSFVDVQGLPYFWNEDGIYSVQPSQQGGLSVENITVGTIFSFYSQIPRSSKQYVRGAYNPLDYTIQWIYRSTEDADNITARYEFDKILNFNTYNKAFYPYTIAAGTPKISGIAFINFFGGVNSLDPVYKYITTKASSYNNFTFSEEINEDHVDWLSYDGIGVNYNSFFATGYKLRGQAIRKFQPQYVQVFSKTNGVSSGYTIQGIWNYANDPNSGKYSAKQRIINALTRFDIVFRRHRIRGHGYSLQFRIDSIDRMPFDILGWAVVDIVNQGT